MTNIGHYSDINDNDLTNRLTDIIIILKKMTIIDIMSIYYYSINATIFNQWLLKVSIDTIMKWRKWRKWRMAWRKRKRKWRKCGNNGEEAYERSGEAKRRKRRNVAKTAKAKENGENIGEEILMKISNNKYQYNENVDNINES